MNLRRRPQQPHEAYMALMDDLIDRRMQPSTARVPEALRLIDAGIAGCAAELYAMGYGPEAGDRLHGLSLRLASGGTL